MTPETRELRAVEAVQADLYSDLDTILGRYLCLSGDEVYKVLMELAEQFDARKDSYGDDDKDDEDDEDW